MNLCLRKLRIVCGNLYDDTLYISCIQNPNDGKRWVNEMWSNLIGCDSKRDHTVVIPDTRPSRTQYELPDLYVGFEIFVERLNIAGYVSD